MRVIYSRPLIWTYYGSRFLGSAIAVLFVAGLTCVTVVRTFDMPNVEAVDYIRSLVFCFWPNQVPLFFGIVLCWVALYPLNAAEPIYYALIPRTIVKRRDYPMHNRLRRLGRFLGFLLLAELLVVIPIASPTGIGWFESVIGFLGILGMITGTLSNLGFSLSSLFDDYKRLIPFDFDRCTFNVANIAPRSQQVKRALRRTQHRIDVTQLISDLIHLLGIQNGFLRLHTNTAAAYDHALSEMRENGFSNERPIVLASDAEYPSIDKILDKYANGPSAMTRLNAQILQLLWNGESDARIVESYATAAAAASDGQERFIDVLAICHVHHSTGRKLPIEQIIHALEQKNYWSSTHSYLLIDGAQAVGNVPLFGTLWEICDFYAFCGHKWLLGTPSLGILVTKRNPKRLQEWRKLPLHAGLSQIPDSGEEFGSTADTEPRISLEDSIRPMKVVGLNRIAEWNTSLADLFRQLLPLAEAGIYDVPTDQGGIVAVRGASQKIKKVARYLGNSYDVITTYNHPIVPAKGEGAIRFCFHCFHNRDDVFRLVEQIRNSPI